MQENGQDLLVRTSTEVDVPAMIDIYSHHVQRGLGEYEFEEMHPEDIKRRRKNMLKRRLPHLVAERAGMIVGYAYAVPFRKRPAYRYAVKHSIYVHKDHLHSGIGRRLLPALIEACAAAGFRQMIAYIDVSNLPSIQLHEAHQLPPGRRARGRGIQIRALDRQPADAARAGRGWHDAAGRRGRRIEADNAFSPSFPRKRYCMYISR